jgi:hypothetical protein
MPHRIWVLSHLLFAARVLLVLGSDSIVFLPWSQIVKKKGYYIVATRKTQIR